MANKPAPKKTVKKSAPTKAKSSSTRTSAVKSTKKVSTKSSPVKSFHTEPTAISQITSPKKTSQMRFKKSYLIILLGLLVLAGVLYAARGLFIAATVNGQPITRLSLIKELERQSGKQTLDSLVTKTLILQEAKKQNIQVSDQQIDDEIKKIEDNLKQQGQNLEQVLSLQGLTRESLRDQVRVQKIVEILLGREIVVTDKEVTDYIASNSAQLPQDMPEATLKTNIKQQLRQQKLSEKFQTWLAELRQNANVSYLVNY